MDNIAAWMGLSFQHVAGSTMRVERPAGHAVAHVQRRPDRHRGAQRPACRSEGPGSAPDTVAGIMAITLDKRTAEAIGPVRLASGVVVIARIQSARDRTSDIQPGDLIHEINGKGVFSADDLRTLAAKLQSGDSVAFAYRACRPMVVPGF